MVDEGRTRITHVKPAPVSSSQPACLVLIYPTGAQMGKRFTLDGDALLIGRGSDCDIVVDLDSVSRRHAKIERRSGNILVSDLNSTNGIFIGDKQVKKYRLSDGDVITLGVHDLVYRDLRQLEDDAPESTDDTFDKDAAANPAFDDTIASDDATADPTGEGERASNDESLPGGEESPDDEEPSAIRK